MRSLILIFTLIFTIPFTFCKSLNNSDSTEYPRYYIVNGDTLGVILTVEQVQKIDNDLELKILLEKSLIDCNSLSSQYIVVISNLENRIAILELKELELYNVNNTQSQIINKLNTEISIYNKELSLCDEQGKNKDSIIKNQKKTITKLIIGGAAETLLMLITIGALIF